MYFTIYQPIYDMLRLTSRLFEINICKKQKNVFVANK